MLLMPQILGQNEHLYLHSHPHRMPNPNRNAQNTEDNSQLLLSHFEQSILNFNLTLNEIRQTNIQTSKILQSLSNL